MSIDRREFLKIAGISTVLGIGGPVVLTGIEKGVAQASQVMENPQVLKAKQWGFVVDMSKIKTDDDIKRIVYACHSIHNVPDIPDPKHEVKWIWKDDFEHTFPEQDTAYMSEEWKQKPFLVFCNHCARPACVRVCPTQATFKRKDGIVMMDMHRCIGCRFCMAACPFGARSFNFVNPRPYITKENPEFPTRMKGVVEKCLGCYERIDKGLKPACIEASNGGITFGDLTDPNSDVRKLIASNYVIQRKPELGTGPSIYYIIGGKENA